MADSKIVISKVREQIKEAEMRAGEDFLAALDEHVTALVADAIKRAKGNDRKTLSLHDL